VGLADGRLLVVGGLVNGTSTDAVVAGNPRDGMKVIGHLAVPTHDAALALVGKSVLYIGGGAATQFTTVRLIDQATGEQRTTGHLPAAASDLGAVTSNNLAYTVGGYDGATWLTSVLSYDAGGASPELVGQMPFGLRYPAIGTVGGNLYVAGGTLASGADSAATFRIDVHSGQVTRLADLPRPTAHAVFVQVKGQLVLAGGRIGTPGANMLRSFDPKSGVTHVVGRIPAGVADPAFVSLDDGSALLVGGFNAAGTATDTNMQVTS
ncbi:MAG: hypothetical protein H7123_02130, partial [Thermoleophilia bacterium]|nr:hypothetical protein [Thermoleophilia bacterium]